MTGPAMMPELRAYPVFDHVPDCCIAFPVASDGSEPVLHFGEFVIVDRRQRKPMHGELFVIEHGRDVGRPRREIAQVWQREHQRGGETVAAWWTGPYARPRSPEAVRELLERERRMVSCDGPYAAEGEHAGYLPSKLVGRVVGILQASFDDAALLRVN